MRRNKMITGVLYFSKDMETFATSLKRIKDLCDEAGCKVEFRMEKDDFVVAFYRNLREKWNESVNDGENVVENVVETLPEWVKNMISEYSPTKQNTAVKILTAINDNGKVTIAEIAKRTNTTERTVQRYLKEFQEAGMLKREGSDKLGEWIIVKN